MALREPVSQRACGSVPTTEGCVWSPAPGLRHLTLQGQPREPRGLGEREAQVQMGGVSSLSPPASLLPSLALALIRGPKCRQKVLALAPGGQNQARCHPCEDHSSSLPSGHPDPHPGSRNRLALFLAPQWAPEPCPTF